MNQPFGYYPSLVPKDLEGVTQTNTYTEKPYSHFEPAHDQVHQNVYDPRKFITSQKTLTKVKSMPLKIYNPSQDISHSISGENLEIRNQPYMRETVNRVTKNIRNSQFQNFSPILNRVKSYDVNQQFSTNLESKSNISHDFSIKTPKRQNYDKFHIKGSSVSFEPVTFQNSFQNKSKRNLSRISQDKQMNSNQATLKKSGVYSIPIPNVRVPLQESQTIYASFNRNVSLSPNNQVSRPNIVFQKPQNVIFSNQQIRRSNISAFDNKTQFQSRVQDQPNQSRIENTNEKYEKISFTKIQQNTQRLGEVELQRPQYRKIYSNNDVVYSVVGPQDDQYKEEKSTCSKILPILGGVVVFLLLAGTLFGLGMMTGLFGGKNYLSRNEDKLIEKDNQSLKIEEENYMINKIEDGKDNLIKEGELQKNVVVTNLEPIVERKNENVVPQQKKEDKQISQQKQTAAEVTILPIQKVSKQTQVENLDQDQTKISELDQKQTENKGPVTTPKDAQSQTEKPSYITTVETQVLQGAPSKKSQTKSSTSTEKVQPQTLQKTESSKLLDQTKQETVTQPSKLPQKLNENQPKTIPQQTKVNPQQTALSKQAIENLPITAPQKPNDKSGKTLIPEVQYIDPEPITLEQANEIIDVIIEENHEIVPQNVKFSLKKDIIDDFQQVPLNFRDIPHVQKISYQHLQALVKSDPKYNTSMIKYRHHEVQKKQNV